MEATSVQQHIQHNLERYTQNCMRNQRTYKHSLIMKSRSNPKMCNNLMHSYESQSYNNSESSSCRTLCVRVD
jgi:hypothetical protein